MRRIVPALLALVALAGATGAARASQITFEEKECTYSRCSYGLTAGSKNFTTTADKPTVEWTVDLPKPADVENWKLSYFIGGPFSSVTSHLVFPSTPSYGGSNAVGVSFFDADGDLFGFLPGRPLADGCQLRQSGPEAGKWVCNEGDSLSFKVFEYGDLGEYGPANPIFPPLDRPITIRMEWTFPGSVAGAEESSFSFTDANVNYGYTRVSPAVPEPTAALLYAGGLAVFAASRRRSA